MDWLDPTASDSVEKREEDMFSLVAGFAARMCSERRAASGERSGGDYPRL